MRRPKTHPLALWLVLCAVALLLPTPSLSCSTFFLRDDGGAVFGKNYDWDVGEGLVIVNKRGVSKHAMLEQNPARWTAKYGSVTFNQYGRELPAGGMNEAGLVVELMWLEEAEYPVEDKRPQLGNVQWIQYQLDNSSSVDEVVASDELIRISQGNSSKIHYLVADAEGNCASIEFLDGKLVARLNEEMPVKVLTNNTYGKSVAFVDKFTGFGGTQPIPQSSNSLDRFARAASLVNSYDGEDDKVDYGFDILSNVAQGSYTQWSIVYDIPNRRVHFRTRSAPGKRYIELDAIDFACASPVIVLDLNEDFSGDATERLAEYTRQQNFKLIKNSFRKTSFLKNVPLSALRELATYPETLECEPGEHRVGTEPK